MVVGRRKVRLEIVTPDRVEFSRDVDSVMAPAVDGYLGILPGHIPLITKLQTGMVRVRFDGQEVDMAVSEGYMEITQHKVVILAEAAELPEEINVERALAAKRRAEERLASHSEHINFVRAQAALQRALNRLKVARYKDEDTQLLGREESRIE